MNFDQYKDTVSKISFGKVLPEAIYIHKSALIHLPELLHNLIIRLASSLGLKEHEWDILKLYRRDFKLSLLSYPDFQSHPYPALNKSLTIDLYNKTTRSTSYLDSANPPILHRRELFLHPTDPRIELFSAFTAEGERHDLYTVTRTIGTRDGWLRAIRRAQCEISEDGHIGKLAPKEKKTPAEGPQIIERHLTALSRNQLSVPMFTLYKLGYLNGEHSILDYGCGRGDDVRELEAHDIECIGWDPVYAPDNSLEPCDIVNLGFVINVIEDADERQSTLQDAFKYCEKILLVSAMLGSESITQRFRPYKDGVLTKRNTFQKYYYQSELQHYIESTLDESAIAVAPGVFIVFKDKIEEQLHLSRRQRSTTQWAQRSTRPQSREAIAAVKNKIDEAEPILRAYWDCCLDLGRPAQNDEFEQSNIIRHLFGSHVKTLAICQQQYAEESLSKASEARRNDLLVYLALSFFSKRKAYTRMPRGLQRDIKYHFRNYQSARESAKELLFSVSQPQVIQAACEIAHRELPASELDSEHGLTFHSRHLNSCPKELRVYIGCSSILYGDLSGVDLIKAHIQSGKVSLMKYDDYEREPIPRLLERTKIKLWEQDIDYFDYVHEYKPTPLLFKSRYISPDEEMFEAQAEFDEKLGSLIGKEALYEYMSADRLDMLLKETNVEIRGFSILQKIR